MIVLLANPHTASGAFRSSIFVQVQVLSGLGFSLRIELVVSSAIFGFDTQVDNLQYYQNSSFLTS